MKFKAIIILTFLLSISSFIIAQNLIGLHANEIKTIMPKLRPKFHIDNTTVEAKSIKFIDQGGDNTLIFFIDDKGICKYQKFMMEVNYAKNTVDTLTKNYKYIDKLTWIDKRNNTDYLIQMQNNEYYFTVVYSLKDE
ncbi:MAG: hypothetical protein A2046_11055 [Bacteroidetes bacterium GWA2_30_7]|nr:MAG: hypothetical protein A2046_11055 [Bacteroidetes bacterium GWA2_30_7]